MPKCLLGETYNRTIKACRAQKKRGRKPGTRKSDCPEGQTYNRSMKACRTMKKRGRPTKKSSGSPMLPMPPTPIMMSSKSSAKNIPALPKSSSPKRITFTMSVSPSANEVGVDKIIAWYMPYFADFDLGTDPSMTYDKKAREYTVSFTPDPNFPTDPKEQLFELEQFVDPDDDGNYPIKIGRDNYFVAGMLRTLNGKKAVEGSNGKMMFV